MKKKANVKEEMKRYCNPKGGYSDCGGFAYVLGFIGAAIYYVSTASGFWNILLAILKALVWPVFLVFELLRFLGA